jgi:hypothetical protein
MSPQPLGEILLVFVLIKTISALGRLEPLLVKLLAVTVHGNGSLLPINVLLTRTFPGFHSEVRVQVMRPMEWISERWKMTAP